jgi:cytidylate kinase
MPRTIVCVSAADGAGGAEVAGLVAQELGARLIDEELIQRAAASAGVDPAVMADVERRRTFLERLIENVGASADAAAFATVGVPPELAGPTQEAGGLRDLIRTAIEETAVKGAGLVIYAHAASVALARRADVLRVLVTAPEDVRCSRVARERSLDAGAAAKRVAQSDRGRADYLKRFYGLDAESPALYDLVVNTERLQPAEAAALVVAAAGAPQAAGA